MRFCVRTGRKLESQRRSIKLGGLGAISPSENISINDFKHAISCVLQDIFSKKIQREMMRLTLWGARERVQLLYVCFSPPL